VLERTEGGVDVARSYASTRDALHVVHKSGGLDGNGSGHVATLSECLWVGSGWFREGIGHGGGGLAVAFLEGWRRNARTVALSRHRQREGRAVVVVGIPRSCRGRDVHMVAEQKSGSGYC
jgi:hypothetical protein